MGGFYVKGNMFEGALEGGYASSRCIREFLERRKDYIQPMVDYVERLRGK